MRARIGRIPIRRPALASETLLVLVVAALSVLANVSFWSGALAGRSLADAATWIFALAVLVALTGLQYALIALLTPRCFLRPVLALLIVSSAVASFFMQRYGIVLDRSMVGNVLHTNAREATELASAAAVGTLVLGLACAALLWTVRVRRRPLGRAVSIRLVSVTAALALGVGAVVAAYHDLGPLLRNHKSLRYTIMPANLVWSLAQIFATDARATRLVHAPPDSVHRRASAGADAKPIVLVIVVGETARAANFALNGYARDTNPELSKLEVINFPYTRACGTSTAVSLPCMFSPFGRADYDEVRIRRHDSLLQVLARARYRVVWLDNQSGCKAVCAGLETRDLSAERVEGLCAEGRCYDEILSNALAQTVEKAAGDLVVVLHQLGNHGPAYFRRYPPELARFTPACENEELRACSREEIVNAYDNAIAYTDRFLGRTIAILDALRPRYDVALAYVSDHGESLGEGGLYLHGIPYFLAPSEQLDVPMLWWLPAGSAQRFQVDLQCLRARSAEPASHDNLYHSVLGLLGVETSSYRAERDLFAGCRAGSG